MRDARISVRIGEQQRRRLAEEAARLQTRESEIVREALESYFSSSVPTTCADLARKLDLIGSAKRLPRDLSTNPRHFRNFGKRERKRSH